MTNISKTYTKENMKSKLFMSEHRHDPNYHLIRMLNPIIVSLI